MIETYLFVFAFIFGSILGSFYNVLIYRLPQKESVVFPASHCPSCEANIRWYDNIPILSYLVLRGKCRSCKDKISWQYPLVELLSGLAALCCLIRWGLSLEAVIAYLFLSGLLVISAIDLKHRIIPDVISIPGMLLFLGLSLIRPEISFWESLLGLLIGGGVIYLIIMLYYVATKKEGMGGGDIKLLALIGSYLGYKSLLFILFTSSLVGSIIGVAYMASIKGDGKTAIPFGPFLSLGAVLYMWRGPELINYYLEWTIS